MANSAAIPAPWQSPAWARLTKIVIYILPVVLILACVWEKMTNHWNYWQIVQEDAAIEWLTALFYLLATPIAIHIAYRFRKQGLHLHALLVAVLAAAIFFVGMEEFSWGQRVLGIETPAALAEANLQEEANLHNLATPTTLQIGFLLIGLYGIVADRIMPILLKPVFKDQAKSLAELVSPPAFIKPYYLVTFLVQGLFQLSPLLEHHLGPLWGFSHKPYEGLFLLSRDREVAECILAIGFLFFLGWQHIRQTVGFWAEKPS